MMPAAGLKFLGGGAVQTIGAGIASSPLITQQRRRPSTTMLPHTRELPASRSATLRRREETAARVFDQGSAEVAANAMAHQALAHEWSTAIHGEKSKSRLELAEAEWSDGLLLCGLDDPAARHSYLQNEPTDLPFLIRNSDSRSPPSAGPVTEVGKQRERNRSAIRLVNTWLHEDTAAESDTWELLKSELNRDRLSKRRLWT